MLQALSNSKKPIDKYYPPYHLRMEDFLKILNVEAERKKI